MMMIFAAAIADAADAFAAFDDAMPLYCHAISLRAPHSPLRRLMPLIRPPRRFRCHYATRHIDADD